MLQNKISLNIKKFGLSVVEVSLEMLISLNLVHSFYESKTHEKKEGRFSVLANQMDALHVKISELAVHRFICTSDFGAL